MKASYIFRRILIKNVIISQHQLMRFLVVAMEPTMDVQSEGGPCLRCRLLDNKWIRRLIFVAFSAVVGVAIYGLTGIQTGITADEITPADSHLIVS